MQTNLTSRRRLFVHLLGGLAIVSPGLASAAFQDPGSAGWGSWNRGDAGTVYAEWDFFSDDASPTTVFDSTPDVGSFGPAVQSVEETSGFGQILGSGNIYSGLFGGAAPPGSQSTYDVNVAAGAPSGSPVRVALQVKTLGLDLDYSSFLLNGVAADQRVELSRVSLGGFGGVDVSSLFLWTLPTGASQYNFTFAGLPQQLEVSLDALSVDVAPVPVPAAAWLFGSALLGVAGVRRRR